MATMTADRLVEDYVRRFENAARHLPDDRRRELVLEIREHIDHALTETGSHDEVAIRNALDRLGPPEEIVAAAEPPTAPAEQRSSHALEIGAVIALLVPVIGWIVGIVLVALSRVWSTREKTLGIALVLVPVLVPFFGLALVDAGQEESVPVPVGDPIEPVDSSSSSVGSFELLLMLLAGLPSAIYLGWRLSLRRQTQ